MAKELCIWTEVLDYSSSTANRSLYTSPLTFKYCIVVLKSMEKGHMQIEEGTEAWE